MDKELENQMSPDEEEETEMLDESATDVESDPDENYDAKSDIDDDIIDTDEKSEDDTDDLPEPPKASNKGLIIATIIVVVLIAAFFVVYFFFNPKVSSFLNGTWISGDESSDNAIYFVFEDNKAYYLSGGQQVDYDVNYISEDKVELIYSEGNYKRILGIKPIFSESGENLKFANLYTTEDYGYSEDNENVIINLSKSSKTAKDLGVERNRETTTATEAKEVETTIPQYDNKMSDKIKKSLQGIWLTDGDDEDSSNDLYIKIDGDNVKYGTASGSMEGKAYYADDKTLVMYFEQDSYNSYLAYTPSLDGDVLTLTPKYQIANGYKYDATDEDTPLVMKKTDKEPTTAATTAADTGDKADKD